MVAAGEVPDPVHLDPRVGAGQRRHDVVALDVDVLRDPVGHLEGHQGQAHPAVEGAGGDPVDGVPARQQPPRRAAPEADVVPT